MNKNLFALLCVLSLPLALPAQPVLAPTPAVPVSPQFLTDLQSGPFPETANSVLMTMLGLAPYQVGPVAIHPHAVYRLMYSTGLQDQPGHPQSSVINEITPGLLLAIGTHWSVDYSPSWTVYSNEHFQNSLGQSLRLSGGASYRDWLFTLNHSYQASSTTQTETAQQTDEEVHDTKITANYQFNSSFSIELEAAQNIRLASGFSSSYNWSTMDWLNYDLGARFQFGLGAGFGYDEVPSSVNMSSEQLQGRLSWRTSDKISLQINGGAEDRQFLGSNVPDLISPTFGVGLSYQPLRYTSLSLNANRSITPSLFQEQATEYTIFSATVTQRLLKHFTASVTGAYNNAQYIATSQAVSAGRTDNYYSINTRLSWVLLKQFSMSLFYYYSSNSSTSAGFGYSSSQTGFEVGYRL